MSMMGGLGGGGGSDYEPAKAPKVPKRSDEKVEKATMKTYQKIKEKDSYANTILGGSAPAPSKSYTAQLFGGGRM